MLSFLTLTRWISESNDLKNEPDKCLKTSYQFKRRRMLQFNTQNGCHYPSNEQMSSAYLKVKVSAFLPYSGIGQAT